MWQFLAIPTVRDFLKVVFIAFVCAWFHMKADSSISTSADFDRDAIEITCSFLTRYIEENGQTPRSWEDLGDFMTSQVEIGFRLRGKTLIQRGKELLDVRLDVKTDAGGLANVVSTNGKCWSWLSMPLRQGILRERFGSR